MDISTIHDVSKTEITYTTATNVAIQSNFTHQSNGIAADTSGNVAVPQLYEHMITINGTIYNATITDISNDITNLNVLINP